MYASITLEIKGKYFVNAYLTANYVISSYFFSLQNMWEYEPLLKSKLTNCIERSFDLKD